MLKPYATLVYKAETGETVTRCSVIGYWDGETVAAGVNNSFVFSNKESLFSF